MPLVSVITAAYNAEAYIAKTIQSVLDQTFRDWEYIIVDDGSNDDTANIIRSFPQVIYIYQQNQGVAAARNTAISQATGKYVAIVDSDDVWSSEKLTLQMEVFQANPLAGLCYTNARTINQCGSITKVRRIPHHPSTTYEYALTRAHHIVTSSVVFNRRYLEERPYRKELPPCEDFYVNLMVLFQSGPGIFIDKILVNYRERSDSISHKNLWYRMEQNEKAVSIFVKDAEAIRPLPTGLKQRALGHLACMRAQMNINNGGNVYESVKLLSKAIRMNPADSWFATRQFIKLFLTLNGKIQLGGND